MPGVSEMAAIVGMNTHNSSGFMARSPQYFSSRKTNASN